MRRKLWFVAVLAVASLVMSGVPSEASHRRPRYKLSISNFRYCKARECSPLDVGYLRTSGGPVSGTDNSNVIVSVKRGGIVTWVYRDGFCDDVSGCSGHNVYFENGGAGKKIGSVPARKGAKTISVRITQKRGSTIRYFCTVNNHYQFGMTGLLRVR